jgi:hypothetical protein
MGGAKTASNLTGSTHQWYQTRWYYRVDKAYENTKLSNQDSYLDLRDFGLNGKDGYKQVKNKQEIAKTFGLEESNDDIRLVSFADMFVALEGTKAESLLSGKFDKDNVEIIKKIITDTDRYKITEVKFEGHASYQGRSTSNDSLSTNRALTVKKWMQEKKFPDVDKASISSKKESQKDNVDKGDNSDLVVKLWRSASIIIKYNESEIDNAATAESVKKDENGNVNTDRVEIQNKTQSKSVNSPSASPSTTWKAAYEDPYVRPAVLGIWQAEGERLGKNYFDKSSWDYDPEFHNQVGEETNIASIKKGTVERYDNEGEFFELLEKNDPFMHNLITDKIRYFDPAFHSISPEGFNARLTFLHQCTRQGSTVGGSDSVPGTAYNLAFGRPPVCVLRLGDFYYTKIVINSISIQYETPQWDLNPEGIGVMPMFAKISMNFVFLGGSDLAGPIARLQNAVSFNYYANTSVYDNRAEMVQYDPDGSGHEIKFKPFSYPDMVHGVDKYKVKKGEVEVGAPKTEVIPSQEANSSLSSQIASVGASDWAFTDMGKTLNKPPIITSFKQPQVK